MAATVTQEACYVSGRSAARQLNGPRHSTMARRTRDVPWGAGVLGVTLASRCVEFRIEL